MALLLQKNVMDNVANVSSKVQVNGVENKMLIGCVITELQYALLFWQSGPSKIIVM